MDLSTVNRQSQACLTHQEAAVLIGHINKETNELVRCATEVDK
jgi:hypothetical protein